MPKKQEDTAKLKGPLMKNKKLAPLLTLVMSFELMIAPLPVSAQATNNQQTSGSKTMNIINSAVGVLGQGYQQMGGGLGGQAGADMQNFRTQQTPIQDGTFNANKLLGKLPGLGNYLARTGKNPAMLNCQTLPTTLYVAKNEVCGEIGITNMQSGQADEAYAYFNQYLQINKTYYIYNQETSNAGETLYGISCMNNALDILKGYFNDRADELDRLVAKIVEMNKNFEETSKIDLNSIEDATALLNGAGAGELLAKMRSRPGFKDDDLDFGKKFNNPACSSMFSAQEFNSQGQGGLIGINETIKATMNEKGQGQFSGATYTKSNAEVVADIQKMATNMSRQVQTDFATIANGGYSNFAGTASNKISSPYGINQILKADFFSDLQVKFNESRTLLSKEVANVQSEFGNEASAALSFIADPDQDASFNSEVVALENRIKNECMAKSIDVGDIMAKLYDPVRSKFANENNTKNIRKRMEDIINNMNLSPAKKLAELQAIESQSGSRYILRLNAPYEVQEIGNDGEITRRTVAPSAGTTTTSYYADVVKNCDAQFKANKLNNKMTGQQAIQNLRNIKNKFKSLATTHAADVKKEITDRLIECRDSATANSSTVGSCTPDRFNTSSPNFCAKAAFSCSTNMQSCAAQTEKIVKDTKQVRDVKLTRYKENVQKNIAELRKLYSTALSKYMSESQALTASFGASFATPANSDKQDITDGSQYNALLKGVSPESILVEDPAKFVALFKDKTAALKNAVVAQQKQVMDSLTKSKDSTKKNYEQVLAQSGGSQGDGSSGLAAKCLANYNAAVKGSIQADQEKAKQQGELGQKTKKFCQRYSLGMKNPGPACEGNLEDLFEGAMSAVGGEQAINEFQSMCAGQGEQAVSDINIPEVEICKNPLIKQNYKTLCERIQNEGSEKVCVSETLRNKEEGTSKTTENPCKALDKAYNYYVVQKKGNGDNNASTLDTLPAFCEAGNNSGPYNTKSFLNQMQQTLGQQSVPSAAQN